jgi:hypothetical protein
LKKFGLGSNPARLDQKNSGLAQSRLGSIKKIPAWLEAGSAQWEKSQRAEPL